MRLLLATYNDKWKYDILRSIYELINILRNKYGFHLVDLSYYKLNSNFESIIEKYPNAKSILVIENHDSILIHHIFPNFFDNYIKKSIFVDDFHKNSNLKINYYENFDIIFTTYYGPFCKKYNKISRDKIIWCPHGYTRDYVLNFNKNPINKILLSGMIDRKKVIYPTRYKMKKMYEGKMKDKITYIKHPGYRKFNYKAINKPIGIKYSISLNSHISCFTCCSKYGYILSKYFEIPATGSLLMAIDPPDDKLEKLGFIDNIHYISCTHDNLEDKIRWILDEKNRRIINNIRINGMRFVRKSHSIRNRAELINNIIKKNEKNDIIKTKYNKIINKYYDNVSKEAKNNSIDRKIISKYSNNIKYKINKRPEKRNITSINHILL